MSAPHRCPICRGSGKIDTPIGVQMAECRTCKGEGIVWEPKGTQESKDDGVIPGQMDLTYDGE